jgi:hypothetical protein
VARSVWDFVVVCCSARLSFLLEPMWGAGSEQNHLDLDRGRKNLRRSTFRSFATGPVHGKLTSRLIAWSGRRGRSSLPKMDIFARPPRRPRHYMWAHAPGRPKVRQHQIPPPRIAAAVAWLLCLWCSLSLPSFNVVVDTPHNGCWIKWEKFRQEHLGIAH